MLHEVIARLRRALAGLAVLLLASLALACPAAAKVQVEFHSFNGSLFGGRYPHTFVVFEGVLDDTGEVIEENYGFSSKRVTPAILAGPVEQIVMSEEPDYIETTNLHFTITVSDETYRKMKDVVVSWRDAPGKFYDLKKRNCIHFVGRIAELGGLKVDFPKKLLRKPKAWLNHITQLNPQLHAEQIH